ncbi:RodZ family helix-turn-helix domain-containing protein [Parablautia muri]|uniref:Uncharacterized protein n=1 Tax=Parablautia muri TaxID=2320879 RepID=A0A9X5BC91_9FIRM|nr:hypothetical protein [Parablautia muri]NBJ91068.1 hypothetical protein [Parablautia muri]
MKIKKLKEFSRRTLALLIAVVMVAGTPQLVSLADEEEISSDLSDESSADNSQSNLDTSPPSDVLDDGGSDGSVTTLDNNSSFDNQTSADNSGSGNQQPPTSEPDSNNPPSADSPDANNQQEWQTTTTVDVNGTPH